MIKLEEKMRISECQFLRYWSTDSKNWGLSFSQKRKCKKALISEVNFLGRAPQTIVESVLQNHEYDSLGEICSLLKCNLPTAEQLLVLCGYRFQPILNQYYIDTKRANDIRNTLDKIEAFENSNLCGTNYYSFNNRLNTYHRRILSSIAQGLERKIGTISSKVSENSQMVDPANGERKKNMSIFLYTLISIAFILFSVFGLFFIGNSINQEVIASTNTLSWIETNGFWGALLGATITGCATIMTTFLIVTKNNQIDYHRERMAVLPVLSVVQIHNIENYVNPQFELKSKVKIPSESFFVFEGSGFEYMYLFKVKNIGNNIAISTEFLGLDARDSLYDFTSGEEKYILINLWEDRNIIFYFNDIYNNMYCQRIELTPQVSDSTKKVYLIRNNPPELYARTNRVRYIQ